jgi:hypothetical protein
MARKRRDFREEYSRRLQRGRAKGLTKAQARGHPRKGEPRASDAGRLPKSSPEIESALRELRSGKSLKASAREAGVSEKRLREFIKVRRLASRKGRIWTIHDPRPRRVPVYSDGELRHFIVPGFYESSKAGAYWHAAGLFVRTNEIALLKQFEGQGLTDVKGHFHRFETDPNVVHRLAAANDEAFHEIYRIIS